MCVCGFLCLINDYVFAVEINGLISIVDYIAFQCNVYLFNFRDSFLLLMRMCGNDKLLYCNNY